jgi:hypothetical protein
VTGAQGHSEDFQQLIERRRKFIDGLDANRGEINLDIFEDFYPDRAHFVYELLQNAEDAGATEVSFTLTPDKLVCEHDGRAFTLEDVKSITGLHDSTKTQAQDKIGKFGVGFKSVFVYTASPYLRSGQFAFRIIQLILPEPIAYDASIGKRTRFEFPFDNPKKPKADAYSEISAGLNALDEKTLLFLSSLQSVKWRIDADTTGAVRCVQHSDFHYEVVKEVSEKTTSSSHVLKFDEPVQGLEKQRVAVAFPLDFVPGVRKFEAEKPLAEQVKIVPAEPGGVAVFFPAVKEASGLRFHLHGPFVPELSRASIKDTKTNLPLFEQIAALSAKALHHIKELGFLTPDFLAVLPNPQDQIPLRYQGIRDAIAREMKNQPLTPTHARGHAPANRLVQARASLKSLLSEDDLEFLVEYEDEPPLWAVGASQRNSRIDNFLSGLGIRDWALEEFIEALSDKVSDDVIFHDAPDEEFLSWLRGKTPAWMQELYALFHAEEKDKSHRFTSLLIVRLADGSLSKAARAYFASETTGSDLPVVDKAVYTTGTSKNQQDGAKSFLSSVGVREIGEAEEIELILKNRYTKGTEELEDSVYAEDLRRFAALVEKQPDKAKLFGEYYLFQADNDYWYQPKDIYLDKPYVDTGLSSYFGALSLGERPEALHGRYADIGIEAERLAKFAKTVGCKTALRISEDTCNNNPEWNYLMMVSGTRAATYINRDYYIPRLAELLQSPSLPLARLVWRTLVSLPAYPSYLQATYQRNRANGSRTAASRLVHELRAASWVPQGEDIFVRPADASRELLPTGFPFDSGFAWLKAIQFGETAARKSAQALQKDAAAQSLGFADAAAAERARRFNELPESEQEKILAELEDRNKSAVPDRPLANPERRAKNVREQALKAPDKETEVRERSVSIGREEVKEQAETFLREHYRNTDGDMTCQICKGALPFKMDDGREYFEVVEFLPELRKRHPQNYLALCPNHSAMYRLVNGSRDTMREDFQAIEGNELAVVLAERDMTIYFSKTHIIDLHAVLDAEESLPPEPEEEASPESVVLPANLNKASEGA